MSRSLRVYARAYTRVCAYACAAIDRNDLSSSHGKYWCMCLPLDAFPFRANSLPFRCYNYGIKQSEASSFYSIHDTNDRIASLVFL